MWTLHFHTRWRCLFFLLPLFCASCSGNGDDLHPVQGTVFFNDKPLKGAVVTLHPKGANDITVVRPVGLTGEDGTFTITTGEKKGAAAGEYVVTLICSEEVTPNKAKGPSMTPPDTQDRFQGKYADRNLSILKVEIKKGPNQLEPFRLK